MNMTDSVQWTKSAANTPVDFCLVQRVRRHVSVSLHARGRGTLGNILLILEQMVAQIHMKYIMEFIKVEKQQNERKS